MWFAIPPSWVTQALITGVGVALGVGRGVAAKAWERIEPKVLELFDSKLPGDEKRRIVIEMIIGLFPPELIGTPARRKMFEYLATAMINWALGLIIARREKEEAARNKRPSLPSEAAKDKGGTVARAFWIRGVTVLAVAVFCLGACSVFEKPAPPDDDTVVFQSLVALTKREALPGDQADEIWRGWVTRQLARDFKTSNPDLAQGASEVGEAHNLPSAGSTPAPATNP